MLQQVINDNIGAAFYAAISSSSHVLSFRRCDTLRLRRRLDAVRFQHCKRLKEKGTAINTIPFSFNLDGGGGNRPSFGDSRLLFPAPVILAYGVPPGPPHPRTCSALGCRSIPTPGNKKGIDIEYLSLFIWWRRWESNPRPEALSRFFYILSP